MVGTERLITARDKPADSFIWQMEAVRTERAPDPAAVHARMAELFRQHWPKRVQRLLVPPGHGSHQSVQGEWIESAPGQGEAALYGPYMPLRAGRHRVTWQVRPAEGATSPVAICDVVSGNSAEPLARHVVQPGELEVSLEFTLGETTFCLQFRCLSTGSDGFSVLRHIALDEHLA